MPGKGTNPVPLREWFQIERKVREWAERMGNSLDGLSDAGRREVLELLLDGVAICGESNLRITLAVPTEEFVSIEPPASGFRSRTHQRSR